MREDERFEAEFYAYLRRLGQADEGWNREVLSHYVVYFARCKRVLDVGCGEGQFLELLRAEGVDAAGIDVDQGMVARCHQKGLDVTKADLFEYLPQHQGEFDGIFCSNLIEHLSAQEAIRFTQLACGSLRAGGVFLVATPNPASLIVHLHEFWRDVTHVRLYAPHLLEFLLFQAGFREIVSGENPRTRWTPPPELQAVPRLLEGFLPGDTPGQWGRAFEDRSFQDRRPVWRRLAFLLRRRLARFLVQTVLFEEFDLLSRMRRVERALYASQTSLLLAPREIFARGVKPALSSEMV